MTTIAILEKGQKARIKRFLDEDSSSRFSEFGLLPGQLIELIRKAPFNGPILLNVLDGQIAIRNIDAKGIEVELID